MALVTQALSLIHSADPSADDVFAFLTDRAEDVAGPEADLRYGAGLLHLGQPPDVEIDGETTGQLIATTFIAVEFVVPKDWRRDLDAGCMAYTNTSSEPSPIRVTRPDSTVSEYSIPPENHVLICENVVHVDTRDG